MAPSTLGLGMAQIKEALALENGRGNPIFDDHRDEIFGKDRHQLQPLLQKGNVVAAQGAGV